MLLLDRGILIEDLPNESQITFRILFKVLTLF